MKKNFNGKRKEKDKCSRNIELRGQNSWWSEQDSEGAEEEIAGWKEKYSDGRDERRIDFDEGEERDR